METARFRYRASAVKCTKQTNSNNCCARRTSAVCGEQLRSVFAYSCAKTTQRGRSVVTAGTRPGSPQACRTGAVPQHEAATPFVQPSIHLPAGQSRLVALRRPDGWPISSRPATIRQMQTKRWGCGGDPGNTLGDIRPCPNSLQISACNLWYINSL